MVEKLSINVEVVPLNVEHNFLIPSDMSVDNAISLVIKTIFDEYPGVKQNQTDVNFMIQVSSGKVLEPKCSFKQLGIIQGEKIILM